MTTEGVSLLLVEDDSMVRGWLRLVLGRTEFRLTGEAQSVGEALELIERRKPDVVLSDQRLPDGTGTDLVRELRRRGFQRPVLLMTANAQSGFNEAAYEAGAQGSVLKTGRPDELLEALRAAARGHRAFDARHPRRHRGGPALSPREREVLRLVASGATNREIAGQLGIGSETVKTVITRAFAKLGTRKRAEAVAVAHERGLL